MSMGETNVTRLLRCISIAGCAAGIVLSVACQARAELAQDDKLGRVDDHGAAPTRPPPADVELFPDTEAGRRLREHLLAVALPSEQPAEADRRYARSLDGLRRNPAESAKLIEQAYAKADAARYFDRWALIKTAADLQAAQAYGLLSRVARAPLPPETNKDTHLFSSQDEEVAVRLRAVDGLTALAGKADRRAEADLLALASDEKANSAVRRRAIKGYLRAGSDYPVRERLLKSRLPTSLHGTVTLKTTPHEEFDAKVKALATVTGEPPARDRAEEKLPEDRAPTAKAAKAEVQQ